MAGRAPVPTAILKIRGSKRGLYRHPEPQPEKGRPPKPEWLDEEAAKRWDELIPQLEVMGVLTVVDGGALARYCSTWSLWHRCRAVIEENGSTYETRYPNGGVTMSNRPEVATYNATSRILAGLEVQFGLTPSSRSKISAGDKPTDEVADKQRRYG